MSETESDLIERLLEEFVERLRQGETPSIAAYEAKYPHCAEQIREFFTAAQMMEQMALRCQRDSDAGVLPSKPVERLGDYRIIREIGRGGMGVVYEAEQESLARRVAVKVLPQSALLKPQALRRFEREARTAARLHHTNIIPVFGVGEDQGYHYIVMQLIRGVGLDRILGQLGRDFDKEGLERPKTEAGPADDCTAVARALLRGEFSAAKPPSGSSGILPQTGSSPTVEMSGTAPSQIASQQTGATVTETPRRLGPRYWESVARIGFQAARALEYAHGRGTLHRDIKPANLLVDLQGLVWIGDFGLAKAMEGDEVSRTGDIAGTLRYMAPERFRGHADFRSDIYSLGLSLYEMLTLRPAYENSHPSALIQRITTQTPPRPGAINSKIPADLETIVMKAIAQEPGDRYSSVQEVADDLERYLDDRPIHARRVSPAERLWRWARRNRMVAALTGLTASLLVLIAILATVGYIRTTIANRQVREALTGESDQRRIAEKEQRKAEALSRLTLATLDEIFEQFVPSRVAGGSGTSPNGSLDAEVRAPVQPVLSKEAAALLERMLTFYDRLAEEEADDIVLRRKIADANRRVGDIRQRLGHYEQAQTAYLRAIDRYRCLQHDSPSDEALAMEIAKIYNELGSLHWTARWKGEGTVFHRSALDILKVANGGSAASPSCRYELARAYYFLGRGGPPDAVPGRKPPPGDSRGRPGKPKPDEDEPEGKDPPGMDRRPRAGGDTADSDDARSKPPPKPEEDGPGVGSPKQGWQSLPPPPTRDNQENLQQAIKILEELEAEFPSIPQYRHLLACCYRDMPPAEPTTGGQPPPDPQAKAIEILRKLVDDIPGVPDYRYDLSKAYAKVHPRDPQFLGNRSAVAIERLQQAMSILDQLVQEHPNVPDYTASQVQALYTLSEVRRRAPGADNGEAALRKALARQTVLVDQFPNVSPYKAWKAILQESLAKLLSNRGRTKEARTLLESAIADLEKLIKSDPQAFYVRGLLGRCFTNLSDVLTQMGETQQAAEILRRGRTYSQ